MAGALNRPPQLTLTVAVGLTCPSRLIYIYIRLRSACSSSPFGCALSHPEGLPKFPARALRPNPSAAKVSGARFPVSGARSPSPAPSPFPSPAPSLVAPSPSLSPSPAPSPSPSPAPSTAAPSPSPSPPLSRALRRSCAVSLSLEPTPVNPSYYPIPLFEFTYYVACIAIVLIICTANDAIDLLIYAEQMPLPMMPLNC